MWVRLTVLFFVSQNVVAGYVWNALQCAYCCRRWEPAVNLFSTHHIFLRKVQKKNQTYRCERRERTFLKKVCEFPLSFHFTIVKPAHNICIPCTFCHVCSPLPFYPLFPNWYSQWRSY